MDIVILNGFTVFKKTSKSPKLHRYRRAYAKYRNSANITVYFAFDAFNGILRECRML